MYLPSGKFLFGSPDQIYQRHLMIELRGNMEEGPLGLSFACLSQHQGT